MAADLSSFLGSWILPALLLVPLVGAIVVLAIGRTAAPGHALVASPLREIHVLTAITLGVEAVLATLLWLSLDPASGGWQATLDLPWISEWGARILMGVDPVGGLMILLTAWLMFLSVVGSWNAVTLKLRSYYVLLLVFTSGCIGVFVAIDLLLFYVMWEIVLIPLYFVIGVWGGRERVGSSFKFFVLTMGSSLVMLVAIGALWKSAGQGTFALDALVGATGLSTTAQIWMFAGFFFAFAVKSAMWPFHTWLPDAQHEAPTTAAIALGIKVGAYGLFRFAMPLFPAAVMHDTVRGVVIGLGVIGIIYGALVAMVQPDFKRLVSYAAISHAGFVLVGLFAGSVESVQGAVLVMLSSGVTNAALFLLLGILHEQRGTGMIANFGGLARVVPMFAVMLTLVSLASIGLPGTNGFVGEFLVLLGAYREFPVATFLAGIGIILAAVYFLWATQRVLFQPLVHEANRSLRDLNRREQVVMGVFAVVIIGLGVAPGGLLRHIEPSARRLVSRIEASRAAPAVPTAMPPATPTAPAALPSGAR
ncbi:MAG: NADH-quinone oxidoreductase subunit M [Gemmatimonadaceae bacterium]|nr:NADH-quinone oxidoreductase subunit M [Gemmatimonadaceae bacterium]